MYLRIIIVHTNFWIVSILCLNQVSFPQIANYFQSDTDNPGEFAVGLDKEFMPLKGHDIGQFPGLEPESSTKESPAYQHTV